MSKSKLPNQYALIAKRYRKYFTALNNLGKADEVRTAKLVSNAFPDACEACPKKLGW